MIGGWSSGLVGLGKRSVLAIGRLQMVDWWVGWIVVGG